MTGNRTKMKMYVFVASVFAVLFSVNINVFAFDGPTHKYVTEKSLELFLKTEDRCKDFYTGDAVKMIVDYCTMPDEDEVEGLYKDHFYNIATGENFMGEKMSALLKFKQHYEAALVHYRTCNMPKCWEELGRALHFLEDLCTPVHGGYDSPMDAINKLSLHVDFEKKCVAMQKKCVAKIEKGDFKYYVDNSLDEIGKMCSRMANDNFFSLEKEYVYDETIGFHSIISAQRVVTGVLYKFYVDTHGLNLN